jgi:Ala-tRNA(Pro) deacylase
MDSKLKNFLNQNDIRYVLYEHEPVYTCKEAQKHCSHINGMACKNLFLKHKKKDEFFLLSMRADKKLDMRKLKNIVGINALSFGKPEDLEEILGLIPGAVSPFGLLNDNDNKVKLFIDKEIWDSEVLTFHPNDNSKTIQVSGDDFKKFVGTVGNEYEIIDL